MLRELQYLRRNTVQSDLFMYLFIHSALNFGLISWGEWESPHSVPPGPAMAVVCVCAFSSLNNNPLFVKSDINRPSSRQHERNGVNKSQQPWFPAECVFWCQTTHLTERLSAIQTSRWGYYVKSIVVATSCMWRNDKLQTDFAHLFIHSFIHQVHSLVGYFVLQ